MSGFRRSRAALLIDLVLLPLGVFKGVLMGGIPTVYEELRGYFSLFCENWKAAGWIGERKE